MGTSSSERAGVRACWRAGVRASDRAWVVTNLNIQNKKVRLEVITPAAGPGVREVSIVRAAPSFVPRPSTLSRLSPGSTAPMSQVRMQCILIAAKSSMACCYTAFLLTAMLFHCFSANSHVAVTKVVAAAECVCGVMMLMMIFLMMIVLCGYRAALAAGISSVSTAASIPVLVRPDDSQVWQFQLRQS